MPKPGEEIGILFDPCNDFVMDFPQGGATRAWTQSSGLWIEGLPLKDEDGNGLSRGFLLAIVDLPSATDCNGG